MNKKSIIIVVIIIVLLIIATIETKKYINKREEEKVKASIVEYIKNKYEFDCVVDDSKDETSTRWTNGLSKYSRTLYHCYRKDNPKLKFNVEYIEGEITRDDYQYCRLVYEAFEYYKPYFDAISDKYYIEVDVQLKEKGIRNIDGKFLYQVDKVLSDSLKQKSFKELITNYQDYIEIGFEGRINTNKPKAEIEEKITDLAQDIVDKNVINLGIGIGFIQYEKDITYIRDKETTMFYDKNDKSFRGKIGFNEYLNLNRKEDFFTKMKEEWQWQY